MRLFARFLMVGGVLLLGQACGEDMVAPTTGDIAVTVTTSGPEPDADGYTLSLDRRQGVAIGPAATRTLPVDAGRHDLKLAGLAGNCRVAGDGPARTVTVEAQATVPVLFAVECSATAGGIRVIVTTSGNATDPDGYTVVLDEEDPRPVAVEDTLELTALEIGEHRVHLLELADACSVSGGDTRTVTVAAGLVTDVEFRGALSGRGAAMDADDERQRGRPGRRLGHLRRRCIRGGGARHRGRERLSRSRR